MDYQFELLYPEKEVTEKTPVVITMHGMGSNFYDLRPLLAAFDARVIQLHLQGNVPFGTGFAFFEPDFSKRTEESVLEPVVNAIYHEINEILEEKKLTTHPKYVLGFSQGAILTASLCLLYPEWLTDGVILSGRLPLFLERRFLNRRSGKQPRIFISQGKRDPLFAPRIGQHLARYLQEHGYSVTYREYPIGHGVDPKVVNDLKDWLKGKVW
ncbi:phospholipase carboxylesterase [Liquorilactobacillus sucicola DSM 21376 = JCM 15457]|uniref:Phospholipase carboxylesterase n=1 Tax=Liquorilactobacillus sucicola DSM 21376 = JCM 15457 TaxID=1423806 RepID=A0A0R2E3S3_9LACO|nr:hypothetical protein [Liquorilactobacillus sucicola]KRN06932.1 phospholipase carboxylesterase [Liquorilactobacillus sucicola DSM 21376 = JCM 15457]